MKIILAVITFAFISAVSGQKNPVVLEVNEVTLGQLKNSQELKAIELALNMPILSFVVDTLTKTIGCTHDAISAGGRKKWRKTYLSVINHELKSLRWSRIGKSQKGDFRSNGKYLLRTSESDIPITSRINVEDGNDLWTVENDVLFMSKKLEIGIGFKTLSTNHSLKNDLQGIDMNSGVVLWNKKMDLTNGWIRGYMLSDSALFVVSDGLHKIDYRNGNGWHIKESITKPSIKSSKAQSSNSPNTFKSYIPANKFRDIASEVIHEKEAIYFASKNNLLKVSHDGEILWKSELPEDWTSKSGIWLDNEQDLIYLINFGQAHVGQQLVPLGKAFIAAFQIENGNQSYLKEIVLGKEPKVSFYDYDDDYLFVVEKENIGQIDLTNGELIKCGELQLNYRNSIPSSSTYILSAEGYYTQCNKDFKSSIDIRAVFSSHRYWIQLNSDLQEIKRKKDMHFLWYKYDFNDFKIMYDYDRAQYAILNADNFEVARFKSNLEASLINDTFYFIKEGKIYELNLNQLDNITPHD